MNIEPKYYCGDCNVTINGVSTGCDYPECGSVEPIEEAHGESQIPIGDFILAQKDIVPWQTANGAYYHYADVCTLLNRITRKQP